MTDAKDSAAGSEGVPVSLGDSPEAAELPRPTYLPVAMAFGVALFFGGIVMSPVVLGAGLLVIVYALMGWIGELLDES